MAFVGMRKRMGQDGFTLVEIMVTVAMLVIVIGAIYGVFRAANQTSMMVEESADVYQTARVMLDRITRELTSIHTIAGTEGSSLQGASAQDNNLPAGCDTLTFTTTAHQPCGDVTQSGDVCTVSYSAQAANDGRPQGFFVTEDYTMGLRLTTSDQSTLPLIQISDMVIGMNCTYMDPSTNEWVDDWMNRTTLPSEVRIELIIKPRRKNSPPVSIVSTVSLPSWRDTPSTTAPAVTGGSSSPAGSSGTARGSSNIAPGSSQTPQGSSAAPPGRTGGLPGG